MTNHPSLDGRVVIVTGGVRGLGREMALELAGQGARLVITGAAETPELRETAAEIPAYRVLALAADLRILTLSVNTQGSWVELPAQSLAMKEENP